MIKEINLLYNIYPKIYNKNIGVSVYLLFKLIKLIYLSII